MYIAIYKNDYSFVEKKTNESIFSLPGNYYVFKKFPMIEQYGNSYKDTICLINNKDEKGVLVINNLELIDIEILFTYNSNYDLRFTIHDNISDINATIRKEGFYHTKAIHNELSFIVRTMSSQLPAKNWDYIEIVKENLLLKTEINKLKKTNSLSK